MAPQVYVASKLRHAPILRSFRDHWANHFTVKSRWLDLAHIEMDERDLKKLPTGLFQWCWAVDVRDVRSCNFLIIYGMPGDNLRGALVEAGIMIGLGRNVFVVGKNENFGTWQYHPNCIRCESLEIAGALLAEWTESGPLTSNPIPPSETPHVL